MCGSTMGAGARGFCSFFSLAAMGLGLLSACATSAPSADEIASRGLPSTAVVRRSPEGIETTLLNSSYRDGSPVWIRLHLPERLANIEGVRVRALFAGVEFPIGRREPKGLNFEGLFAIPYQFTPGPTEVTLAVSFGVEELRMTAPLVIVPGQYASEALKVAPRTIQPPASELRRIREEQKEVGRIYGVITPKIYWNGPFQLPIESVVTSHYGSYRVYNGQKQSPHLGMDLRAKVGTPIKTPAAGKVVLAKDLFFTGWTVIVDHGYGMFSVFAHMSKLAVRVGDELQTGQKLGLSGATGRVSGPHLHWGAVIQRVKVDPELLILADGMGR